MVRGDELVQKRGLPVPNFLKMDVEGCELDVFQGMRDVLKDTLCRGVFCEVHFELLAERGQPYAPKEIGDLLKSSGLTSQRWTDSIARLCDRHLNSSYNAGYTTRSK